ncbi:cation:proton antiporter [Bdellovibrio bacteriovorus]|uniref:Cation:proton antiporter n=1 Tax=Bdellovibrio bacteriovorus (strain ATCC 15356 / DSM 50701 / NCIMB 9529 / HD100) TaxID=264462 RepID=Q6MLC8_BDEBA|nr:cation:proton antiporter [Bdellovibrio bacteriovorus]AHZ84575.1 cation:proton antiporter [Bdellovibrio bacteriovorus]BEV68464.1 Glutathione-regulated potassium-efflux system protein KefB [Bdellovibrio bacteriovorus]CAE79929.1 cation:proton antiporter [Bdellovibrio bacteriovorus HD100]
MHHLPHLITDLGFILMIAALSTLLFKKLGQPQVLGYLIAGFLVSPHVPFLPTVTDKVSIQVWSEIGVIFLLFSLGLEFSFKKLFKVGGSASFTAVFEVVFMVALGYLVGHLLGWNNIDSLFFGGILSVSSTTIIVRAFQELGMKGKKFVELVFGILVVEDIVAILLLVLLTAIASSDTFSTAELAFSGLRLLFFIALWFVVGIFLIPIFLRKIRSLLEDETLLLVSIGLCFMMVMIAAGVGFSPALGAFVMGSLLAETPEGHQMEHVLQPVKNLFAAIFFVSVGMMIDPKVIIERWDLVILVTLVTIVGKFVSTFLGAVLSGQGRKQAFQSGMSLAQIGEFSFIIAALGVSLKVTSDFLYPLAIAVSAVTTFTTPYLIKVADPFYRWVEARLPEGVKRNLDQYHASFSQAGEQKAGTLIMKTYGMKILLNTVMVIAIMAAFKAVVNLEIQKYLQESPWAGGISMFICLLISAPFIWGIVMSGPSLRAQRELEELQKLRGLQAGLFVGRLALAVILLGVLVSQFATLKVASGVIVAVIGVAALAGQLWVQRLYQFIEKNFQKNLTEKERKELVSSSVAKNFLPWETTLGNYDIAAESSLVGRTLRDLSFKENYGVTVAAVFRGAKRYFAPDGEFVLWPHDKLICFGSEEELQSFHTFLEGEKAAQVLEPEMTTRQDDYRLSSFVVLDDSKFKDKTIRESGIRESYHGMVVGIERGPQRILGPRASFTLRENDLVWVVSDKKQSQVTV